MEYRGTDKHKGNMPQGNYNMITFSFATSGMKCVTDSLPSTFQNIRKAHHVMSSAITLKPTVVF
jgi:hypothetical protein